MRSRPGPIRERRRPSGRLSAVDGVVSGRCRIGRRTKDLVPRLLPGDIAVIDHQDLDRVAAEGLVRARPAAVVNAAQSISGRYPNLGPLLLAEAGIPLIDGVGASVMDRLTDGQIVDVEEGTLRRGGELIATGVRQSAASLTILFEAARLSVDAELARFAENTLEYLREESHLISGPIVLPDLRTELSGRHVLIVVRGGEDSRADLATLRSYIRELRPVLIAVDGGADALIQAGHRPDIILGDFDSVTDSALRGGAELVVHGFTDGRAPGSTRLDEMGLDHCVFRTAGTSEDIAMLLAYEKGAELIVAVGTHASMVEFLDKGRSGMASTFLVRLKIGPILVDAKGVSRLYQSRVRTSDLAFLVAAALFSMFVMVAVAQPLHVFVKALWFSLGETVRTLF